MGLPFPAGHAPARPEIDKHILAFEILEAKRLAVDIGLAENKGLAAGRAAAQAVHFFFDLFPEAALLQGGRHPVVTGFRLREWHAADAETGR